MFRKIHNRLHWTYSLALSVGSALLLSAAKAKQNKNGWLLRKSVRRVLLQLVGKCLHFAWTVSVIKFSYQVRRRASGNLCVQRECQKVVPYDDDGTLGKVSVCAMTDCYLGYHLAQTRWEIPRQVRLEIPWCPVQRILAEISIYGKLFSNIWLCRAYGQEVEMLLQSEFQWSVVIWCAVRRKLTR